MKIAYIISDINKAVFFENTALALRDEGLDVCYIVINYENGALVEFLKENQFKCYTIKSGKISQSFPQILKVRRILKKEKVDTVHCHLAQANWIGLWAAYLGRVPNRTYTRHSGEPLKLIWKEQIIDRIQNRLATNIISISQVIDELLESQNVPSCKRTIIHHGFELSRFSENDPEEVTRIKDSYNPNNNYPVVGVIARWMQWKGIQDIIDAFVLLLEEKPNALLCLFGAQGHGDYHEALSHHLHQIPPENVRIVPFENNVFDLYRLFDVYVHVPVNPSCEAFGQTYVEALAAEVPSVFTMSGIAREFIVHEKHALIVPFENPKAIADAVLRLLADQQLVQKLKTNGKQIVHELFDFHVYQKNLVSFYQSLESKSKKKKIIYVVSDIKRAIYFEQTAIALRDREYEIIFVLINCKDSALDIFLKNHGFKRYYMGVSKIVFSTNAIWRLRKIFKLEKPDVVHTHLSKGNWVGLNAAWLSGIKKRIYTRHSGKPLEKHFKEMVLDRIQNKISTRIIAVSENASNILKYQGVPENKQKIIYHGFDLERFENNDPDETKRIISSYNPEGKTPVIGVISRWMELKGLDYVISAFHRILLHYPDALLCIFGEQKNDEYSMQLHEKLSSIPQKNRCIVNFEDNCFDLYQLFDIYIHVPVNETCEAFGQTYIEALASGIPSIFTKSGIAQEFIEHEYNALVVPFKNDDEIYKACLRLLTDPELREQLIKNGKKSVQSFNFDSYMNQLVNVYQL